MHFLQVECESSSTPGADPDLQLMGKGYETCERGNKTGHK